VLVYHVTPTRHLAAIFEQGLMPQRGVRAATIDDDGAIYLFVSLEALHDGVMSWLGSLFDEDEPLAILNVDLPDDFPLERHPATAAFEVISTHPIPSKYLHYQESI